MCSSTATIGAWFTGDPRIRGAKQTIFDCIKQISKRSLAATPFSRAEFSTKLRFASTSDPDVQPQRTRTPPLCLHQGLPHRPHLDGAQVCGFRLLERWLIPARSARFFASRAAQAASRTSPGLSVTSVAAPVNCVVTVSTLSRRRRQRQSVTDPEQCGYPASTSPAVPITFARVSFQCRAAVVKLTDCYQRPSDQTGNHPSIGTTHTHARAVRLDLPC